MKINGSSPNELFETAFSEQIEMKEVERLCSAISIDSKLSSTLKTMINNPSKE
jgi:hypothetical protein